MGSVFNTYIYKLRDKPLNGKNPPANGKFFGVKLEKLKGTADVMFGGIPSQQSSRQR
jgi:hypothetical protein